MGRSEVLGRVPGERYIRSRQWRVLMEWARQPRRCSPNVEYASFMRSLVFHALLSFSRNGDNVKTPTIQGCKAKTKNLRQKGKLSNMLNEMEGQIRCILKWHIQVYQRAFNFNLWGNKALYFAIIIKHFLILYLTTSSSQQSCKVSRGLVINHSHFI